MDASGVMLLFHLCVQQADGYWAPAADKGLELTIRQDAIIAAIRTPNNVCTRIFTQSSRGHYVEGSFDEVLGRIGREVHRVPPERHPPPARPHGH